MIAILFWLLSSALIAYFVVLLFKATVLLKRATGTFSALFFVAGIITCAYHKESNPYPPPQQWVFIKDSSLRPEKYIQKTLQHDASFDISLSCGYRYPPGINEPVPVSATCQATGFTTMIKWHPDSIAIQKTREPFTFHYRVSGTLDWLLLKWVTWTETKIFEGNIHIGDPE